jgi:hypothetical protein
MNLMRQQNDMTRNKLAWLGLILLASSASAQLFSTNSQWSESEVPAPPAFSKARLIPVNMPSFVSVRLGVDPGTLAITPDGVVRYVMVAVNESGSMSAMYEGIRCASAEVKTYARFPSSGPWVPVQDPQWQDLNGSLPSKHALALARQGVCEGRSVASSSAAGVISRLKTPRIDY